MRGVVTHRPPDVPHGMLKRVGVLPSVHLRSRVRGCKRKNARTKMPLLLAAAGIRLVSDLQLGAADTHMDHARCGWSVEAWTLPRELPTHSFLPPTVWFVGNTGSLGETLQC